MKRHLIVPTAMWAACLAPTAAAGDGSPVDAFAAPQPASVVADKPTLTYAGQTFELAQTRPGDRLATAEYTLAGEKLAEWTQLVTVQKVTGTQPANPEQLVQFFRLRLKPDEAKLDLLAETEKGRAFAVHFPAKGATEEQVMICLAFVDPAQRQVLNVVQYAVKPHRAGAEVAATQLRAWKDRLVAQTVVR